MESMLINFIFLSLLIAIIYSLIIYIRDEDIIVFRKIDIVVLIIAPLTAIFVKALRLFKKIFKKQGK